MIEQVNGLPVAVLVVLVGAGVVVALWLALRFGRAIGLFLVSGGIVAAVLVGAVAMAGQSAANFETAKVATKAVAVAQTATNTANTSNLLLVAGLGCAGGVAFLAVLASVGVGAYAWHRVQAAETQRQTQRPAMLPQSAEAEAQAQVMAGDFDLSWLSDDNFVEQGEMAWTQNENVYW